ncbi:MAG: NADH-quinone oxidoreductase subunit L [Peptococcaceae bacterium]|nr:NADH-quinone oxidoreductase subunit L [Peptococcaceae bacterium]
MTAETLVGVLVLLPFIVGGLSFLIRSEGLRKPFVIAFSLVMIIASLWLFLEVYNYGTLVSNPSPVWEYLIFAVDCLLIGYFLYVGITNKHYLIILLAAFQSVSFPLISLPFHKQVKPVLYIDLLSVIMCLVISLIGSLIVVFALDYMRNHEVHHRVNPSRQHIFFFFLISFLGAMNGLVFANSLFWLFLFWEITTLCCYHLIRHDLTEEALGASLRALWMNLAGAVALIIGIGLSLHNFDTVVIQELISSGVVGPALLLTLALFCFTGFTKAAQVPWQGWLLGAMVAPTPVSALLHSSTMVKAGVYLVLRLAPGFVETQLSAAIAIFGAFVFMVTSVLAIGQSNAKRVLAYSTIANLGLIICCAGINTGLAIAAAMVLIVFHAISKGLLFLVVGTIEQQVGSRDIEDMEGLITKLPVLSGIALVGMISMLFLPFGVVFGKWAGIQAASEPVTTWFFLIVAMLVMGSASTLVYYAKWMGRLISCAPDSSGSSEVKAPLAYGTLMALAVLAVGLSFLVVPLVVNVIDPAAVAVGYEEGFKVVGTALATPWGAFPVWPLFVAVVLALVIPALVVRLKPAEVSAVYMCGVNVDERHLVFRSAVDGHVQVETGGTYWTQWFDELSLNKWINAAGIVLLAVLFVGVVL